MLSIENSLLIHVFCQFLHVSLQYELKLWTLFPSCSPSNSAVKKWNTLVGIFENDLIKQSSLPFRRRPKHVRSWASGAADVPKRWDFALQHCFLHSFVFQSCGDHALTCLHVWRHTHTHTHYSGLHPCLIAYQPCFGCNCFPGKCCSAVFMLALLPCGVSQLLRFITIQLVCRDEEEAGRSCTGYKNKKLFCRWGAGRWGMCLSRFY